MRATAKQRGCDRDKSDRWLRVCPFELARGGNYPAVKLIARAAPRYVNRTIQEDYYMCGIIGFAGRESAAPILLDGLARMEYRGYDSAGVAVRSETQGLQIRKSKGRLKVLSDMGNAVTMPQKRVRRVRRTESYFPVKRLIRTE